MKKLFILFISIFMFTSVCFAKNCINVKPTFISGNLYYEKDNERYAPSALGFALVGEYLYLFDNGLSLGASLSLQTTSITDSKKIGLVEGTIFTNGVGISLSPVVGWTFNKNIFQLQLLSYPVIFDSSSCSQEYRVTIKDKKVSSETKDFDYTALKSGIGSNFLWGWEHFKLGFGCGLNAIWDCNYRDSSTGFEFYCSSNFTFLF